MRGIVSARATGQHRVRARDPDQDGGASRCGSRARRRASPRRVRSPRSRSRPHRPSLPDRLRRRLGASRPRRRRPTPRTPAPRRPWSGVVSTAITGSAPTATAAISAERPTPPQPITATRSPGRTPAVFQTAPTPVVTAQPTSAATSNGTSLRDRDAGALGNDGRLGERRQEAVVVDASRRRARAGDVRSMRPPAPIIGQIVEHSCGRSRRHSRALAARRRPRQRDVVARLRPASRRARPPRRRRRPRARARPATRSLVVPSTRCSRSGRRRSRRGARAPRPALGAARSSSSIVAVPPVPSSTAARIFTHAARRLDRSPQPGPAPRAAACAARRSGCGSA